MEQKIGGNSLPENNNKLIGEIDLANALIVINEVEFTNSEISNVYFSENNKLYILFDSSIFTTQKPEQACSGNNISISLSQDGIEFFNASQKEYEFSLNYTSEFGFQKQLVVSL